MDADLVRKARRHLARRDPVLKRVMANVGPFTLTLNPDRFSCLARSIISQQISGKAAQAISERLSQQMGSKGLTPSAILAASDELLRTAGLSGAKQRALRDLADKVHSALVPLNGMHELDDEEVIGRLIPVRGIGRWTAQMFLIFSLGRPDILPVDDLGLRVGVQKHYGLEQLPTRKQLVEISEPWQPYRSVATWYFWRSLGGVPQSK
jgi:DNA-3-methyladenine glycosylase II